MRTWRKSSYSQNSGGNCLEVRWATSSYTQGGNSNCVEAQMPCSDAVNIRDTRYPEHGHLTFNPTEWRAFLAGLRTGELG